MRVMKRFLALFLSLALLPCVSLGAAEGYAMAMGEVIVYLDSSLSREYGTLGDASVVYVVQQTETNGNRAAYTLIFGVEGVLRLGYADAADLMPLGAIEAELYESGLGESLLYNGRARLVNCAFTLAGATATPVPPSPTPLATVAAAAWETPRADGGNDPTEAPASAGSVRILVEPEDIYAFNGEEFVLAVGAEGAVSYQWQYFDGETWKDSVMSQATASAMQLVAFTGGRDRVYRCELTGRDGVKCYTREVRVFVR